MRAVVQRVNRASVSVDGEVRASIEHGMVVLLGLESSDDESVATWMAEKLVHLRIFEDEDGRMNRSVSDVGGSILLVPNFTVAGDCRRGRRPSFDGAMAPDQARGFFASFASRLSVVSGSGVFGSVVSGSGVSGSGSSGSGVAVRTGVFGAHMHVSLENDGPITLVLERRAN